MRLLVLAAGKGTRLKPYTDLINKSMILISGYPLLYHNIAQCVQVNPPITEIIIVIGYLGDQIKNYFGNTFQGIPIQYVYQETLDGIAGAVERAAPLLTGEPFLMTLGDELIFGSNLHKMVAHYFSGNADSLCGVLCGKSADEIRKNYTLRLRADGSIDKVIEKPIKPFNDLLGLGYCIFSESTLSFIKDVPFSPIHKQRGMCDWITVCIDNGLRFFPYVAGQDAININSDEELIWLKNKLSQGEK